MLRCLLQFLTVILILPSTYVAAQEPKQSIRGSIVDEDSHVPLSFATLILKGQSSPIGTTSDEKGKFVFDDLPIGRYTIEASYMGYEPKVAREIAVNSGKEVFIRIGLQESFIRLGEIKIRPKEEKNKPVNSMGSLSSRRLSIEEASRYAGGFDDPARLASSFAGVIRFCLLIYSQYVIFRVCQKKSTSTSRKANLNCNISSASKASHFKKVGYEHFC